MNQIFAKSSMSFRIGVYTWLDDQRFSEMIQLFEKNRNAVDEITFFLSQTHSPLPIETVRSRLSKLSERMRTVKELGYSSGINILSTIGHHDENLGNCLSGNYTKMTNLRGEICAGSFCPNDSKMQEYITKLYQEVAHCGPDYIWIDDDIRLYGHMPISETCFCNNCLNIFGKETGIYYSRDELDQAFNTGKIEDRLHYRKRWLEHNRMMITNLLQLIRTSVDAVNPQLTLGLMCCSGAYEGYDFDQWAKTLSESGRKMILWRPGGGFYSDDRIKDMVRKSHEIGRQVSCLPGYVRCIQSEIENFIYFKSTTVTTLEIASHIAAGCTGAAINVLSDNGNLMQEFGVMVGAICENRKFYDFMVSRFGRSSAYGIFSGWNQDSFAVHDLNGNWFSNNNGFHTGCHTDEMFQLGLPPAYQSQFSSVYAITGDSIFSMNHEQIMTMLSNGVYMDSSALTNLNELGFGNYTGFQVNQLIASDCIEVFSDHEFNRGYAMHRRDCRQSFNHSPAASLQKTADGAQILSHIVDYEGQIQADCTMGLFENSLGGRICVAGYFPWVLLHNHGKSSQIKNVLRWLSRDRLPAYVDSFHLIHIRARVLENNEIVLALINTTYDKADNVNIFVNTTKNIVELVNQHNEKTSLRSYADAPEGKIFQIPQIEPYSICLLMT